MKLGQETQVGLNWNTVNELTGLYKVAGLAPGITFQSHIPT